MSDRINRIVGHLSASPTAARSNNNLEAVVICGAVRTPMGGFGGVFKTVSACDLGATAIRGVLNKSGASASNVDEVFVGNVMSANLGQAPAKQAALKAGIPTTVPCTLINKVCASSMKAFMLAAQSIQTGQNQLAVVAGMESMSQVPYYSPNTRSGARLGDAKLVDGLLKDGLVDPYNKVHMGVAGEHMAKQMHFTRQDQDDYALESFKRAQKAHEAGYFKQTIVPVEVKSRRGTKTVSDDELIYNVSPEKMAKLKPAFQKKNGTITAANASALSDGACAIILASESRAKSLGLPILARVRGFADAARDPMEFTIAPADAMPLALKRAGINPDDLGQNDWFEVNEAFSVVALANMKLCNLPHSNTNAFGGAVSLGHPLGCSGARILVTLVNVLNTKQGRFGVAGICNGGGGASAVVIERNQQ